MAPIGKHRQSLGVPRHAAPSDAAPKGEKPPTTLKLWIIRIQSGGVVVEGYKAVSDNDATTLQNWRSTPIASRIDAKTLKTHSGSIYKLKGGIDEDEAAEAGIPEELIEEFARGFPENWKELVEGHLAALEVHRRRQSLNTNTTMNSTVDGEEKEMKRKEGENRGGKGPVLQFDDTMDTEETTEGEEEERLKEAKKRRSLQKGRKSMMARVHPATPIEEEEENENATPARKTPRHRQHDAETPMARQVEKKTPNGRQKSAKKAPAREEEEEMEVDEPIQPTAASAARAATSAAARTPKGAAANAKKTPKGREKEEEEEVFATPDETPNTTSKKGTKRERANTVTTVAIHGQQRGEKEEEEEKKKREERRDQRRSSFDAIPREIYEQSIPLTNWVIRFVRGGTDTSIFPHFQFKCCGFRPECTENEWSTSCIQKVVPPYIMFTSSSIYRLDGPMDVNMSSEMGFSPQFNTDFLMGFPIDWEERLETFFNKTFGPPPQPTIVEVMSDGGAADEPKPPPAKRRFETPKNSEGPKIRGLRFEMPEEEEEDKEEKDEKRKEAAGSSSSSSGSEDDDSESDEEAQLRREARKVEKEMEREERREAERRAKAKEEKKKRFSVQLNLTPDGVAVSRSGRTLRTPMANWAGEKITYDSRGNVIGVSGVTTVTKLTVGKANTSQTNRLAAHYGVDSPDAVATPQQKEKAIAPPSAELPKTPAPRKSKAANEGYSDEETEKMYFHQYTEMLRAQADSTPAFNMKGNKKRRRVVESSDSEAEAEERRKEEKRKRREERRRLRESEEEDESSDGGWRRKKKKSKTTKKIAVKKEKVQPKPKKSAPRKKKQELSSESEEDEESGDEEGIDHHEDAATFVPSDGSDDAQGGYSDDELFQSDEEATSKNKKKKEQKKVVAKKEPVKRAKTWKKEELIRLKLAIQAADPTASPDGWETVARSIGGERTAEECKKIARDRLKMAVEATVAYDPFAEGEESSLDGYSGAESGAASEDEAKKGRRKAKMDDDNRLEGVKAKKGTIAYAVEMEAKKRELMLGGRASQEDVFKDDEEELQLTGANALPSVAVFDPDDSLLECLDDDDGFVGPEPVKQRTTKTARMAAAPATPRLAELSSYDDSPGGSAPRSTRRSSAKFIPSPVVNQNDLTRYVHQLSRAKNVSMLSKSMADRSRMMPPPLPASRGGRNVARAAEAIDKVEQSLRSRRRRGGDELDDLDEDEENDDNVLPAGF